MALKTWLSSLLFFHLSFSAYNPLFKLRIKSMFPSAWTSCSLLLWLHFLLFFLHCCYLCHSCSCSLTVCLPWPCSLLLANPWACSAVPTNLHMASTFTSLSSQLVCPLLRWFLHDHTDCCQSLPHHYYITDFFRALHAK